jgi:enoyl-CoA hydratase/carnithine racemase
MTCRNHGASVDRSCAMPLKANFIQRRTAMAYDNILYEVSGQMATITLNRPEVMNAISPALENELHQALDQADTDDQVRAIILTGAGRAFSAGYDSLAMNRDAA